MEKNFINDVVLVTGSTRGIGRGIAEGFAEKGAKVIINGVHEDRVTDTVKNLNEKGYTVIGTVFDTADREKVLEEIRRAESVFGRVTVLVNNAGISPKKDGKKVLFKDMEFEEWSRVVDVNINGVFNCCKAVVAGMIEMGRGKIVNVSSAFARYYDDMASIHYVTTKTAVLGFTRALSGELCRYGINCNAIAPGRTWTEMVRGASEEANARFMETIPVRRFAEVEEIANTVLFLAGEEASYFHGATLDVNGGIVMV